MLRFRTGTLPLLVALCLSLPAAAADSPKLPKPPLNVQHSSIEVDIPYQMFKLDNGLTVLVHEDHKAPIVAVNIWYHVGSKNEKPGKTGFAHLFEHLMFNGSEGYNDDYFKVMDRIGATDLNGTTNEDRTNYFQNVPTTALDTALWMESDRMGHLLGAITQAKLDEQRGVVQNEKRQGENEPYAISEEMITKACYPSNHPYSWTVIGSMDDLNAAKLEDVQDWFKTYYGPSNAVMVLAGDIDLATAKEKANKYFGDINSGPPVGRAEAWPAKRTGTQRATAQDRVPQPRLYKVWNVPGWGTEDADHLDMVAAVLANGKTSRLFKRLVYDDQIATNVQTYMDSREIGSLFTIVANAKPNVELSTIEKAVDEELQRLIKEGPTEAEVARVRTQTLAGFIRGSERIGGFGGKSDVLAKGLVFRGSPDSYKASLERVRTATPAELREAAATWLSDGVYALEITPFPDYTNASTGADRSKVPDAGSPPTAALPKVEKATLSSGLQIVLAHREAVPVVNLSLLLEGGYASDQFATPGTASLAMNMLDEGTSSRNALQISEELQRLGATLNTGANLDQATVAMSALKANLGASLDILADVVLHPSFPEEDFQRLKQQRLAQIRQEKSSPIQMGLRVFPPLIFGTGHAYGLPFTGSGYEDTVTKMDRAAMVKYHQTWFKPNHSTLVVVGDTTMAELKPMLEDRFKGWSKGDVPEKNLAQVKIPDKAVVYLVDRPGALQSVILAGHVAPPTNNPDEIAIQTLNTILGGSFTSRLNMNLREDKHWAYGAGSFFVDARGQRPFLAYAPVQTDKTAESVAEILREAKDLVGKKPLAHDEIDKIKVGDVRSLPGEYQTAGAVLGALSAIKLYDRPDDYVQTLKPRIEAQTDAAVQAAAHEIVRPDALTWVVVGDLARIEAGVRALKLGEVKVIDADGKVVR